ncbi:ferritin-like domain-containing protein [Actinokineospora iranica]|uniref:Ferritin-like n=1 Tax=Actinokineospora iranica TaxID=1271860 RepID=A0A1G6XLG0_9PSEU|nr:ferritin-like protein [Actinokineospora iranica]SDD78861.1 Ferritin-like [Actinokineospora iranica]
MTTTSAGPDTTIATLMATADEDLDVDWLRTALQHAIILELATIPPYSCGLWSIIDPERDKNVHKTIREIIFDEMSHMALVGNMLTAIGGEPLLAGQGVVPRYPGRLPGGVRPELEVRLGGLTRASLDMYSQIEKPDVPIVSLDSEHYPSIGAFYAKIKAAFLAIDPALIRPERQISFDLSQKHGEGNAIIPMANLTTVLKCLDIIMEQGEGTSTSPENPYYLTKGELSHYYAFRELYHGRKLVKGPAGIWAFTGDPIAMPRTYAAAEVPAGGWAADPGIPEHHPHVVDTLYSFNHTYSGMLLSLEEAWRADDPVRAKELVGTAIGRMGAMRELARDIMTFPLPDESGWRYCPEFRYVDGATP